MQHNMSLKTSCVIVAEERIKNMKNSIVISNLSPRFISHNSPDTRPSLLATLSAGLLFWTMLVVALTWLAVGVGHAEMAASDPLVMKVYPDGTKVVLRWSEVGKQVDNGEKFGGAPRIVAYDPAKDGIVPIGEPSQKTATSATNVPTQGAGSVVTSEQPAKMDYSKADPAKFDENLGPLEGFVFRTGVGPAFQQSVSSRTGSGSYQNFTFKPGIRFDLEPAYNVTEWFRVGVETGFIFNRLQRVAAEEFNLYPGDSLLGNTGFYQVPVLANVRFQFPSDGPWRGYFGGGIGATWSVLQASALGIDPYTSYSWNLAYQIATGFTYTIDRGFDLDVGLKMLSTPNPSFQDSGQTKPIYNYTAQVGLAWRF